MERLRVSRARAGQVERTFAMLESLETVPDVAELVRELAGSSARR
jgi:hypothetical protein